jgi:hypothetical protein
MCITEMLYGAISWQWHAACDPTRTHDVTAPGANRS